MQPLNSMREAIGEWSNYQEENELITKAKRLLKREDVSYVRLRHDGGTRDCNSIGQVRRFLRQFPSARLAA